MDLVSLYKAITLTGIVVFIGLMVYFHYQEKRERYAK